MNSRSRILCVLNHKEPDHVPLDLAGTHVSGIHINAYRNLCTHLGIKAEDIEFSDTIQQIVIPNAEVLEKFGVDTRGIFPLCSHNWNVQGKIAGAYREYHDEWGMTHHFPVDGGYYWSLAASPLAQNDLTSQEISKYPWPAGDDPRRFAGLMERTLQFRKEGKTVLLKSLCAGLFEMGQRIRGMENFLMDLIADKKTAEILLDKILELKISYWKKAAAELGEYADIAVESDDYGTQESQLISYETFKEMIFPRLKCLVSCIKNELNKYKKNGEKSYVFFHSCGNIRPFIRDFIDIGIDIINPVHINAAGMDPVSLKKDFGKDTVFWGGGVETQNVLPRGTENDVREDVKKNLEVLMPGGGYVFNTVHNIQADVPPQNIVAMYETLMRYGRY